MAWTKADYQRLGDFIVAARQAQKPKLSRPVLAKVAGISSRTLADIENGELGGRKAFSSETMSAISIALGWQPTTWRAILNNQPPLPGELWGEGALTADGSTVEVTYTAPEAALGDDELDEIEEEVEEFRALLIRRALRRGKLRPPIPISEAEQSQDPGHHDPDV